MTKTWLATGGYVLALHSLACGNAGEGAITAAENDPSAARAGDVAESESGGGEIGDIGELTAPIVGGSTDQGHNAVLAIALVTRREEALCSGSLIAPNLVLTARHCVAVTESETVDCSDSTFGRLYEPGNLWVSSSTTVGGGSNFYPVREIAVPQGDSELCGSDIALLILGGQFVESSIAPIAPRLDEPAERGELFTAVGFGSALEAGDPGVRRALSGLSILCGPDDCNAPQLLTTREFVGEQGVCDGDSGGPALDGSGRVVGVASRATEDCGLAVYSAVAPWRDWIVGVADRALELGTYDAPSWLSDEDTELGDSAGDTSEPIASNDVPSGSDAIGSGSVATPSSHLDSSSCALTGGFVGGGSSSGQGLWATSLAVAGLALGAGRRRSRPH
jgi:hypothetical protein